MQAHTLATLTLAQPGGGRGEISSLSEIQGANFRFKLLSTAIFHCQNSMNTNTSHAFEGPCRVYKGQL